MLEELQRIGIPFNFFANLRNAEASVSESSRAVVMIELSWADQLLTEEIIEFEQVPCFWEVPLIMIIPNTIPPKIIERVKKLNGRARFLELDISKVDQDGKVDSSQLASCIQSFSVQEQSPAALPKPTDLDTARVLSQSVQFDTKEVGDVHAKIMLVQKLLGGQPLVLGGHEYPFLRSAEHLAKESLLPTSDSYHELINEALGLATEWEQLHFSRVAYTVSCVAKALQLSGEDYDLALSMAYLYAWPHGLSNARVSRCQYTRKGQEEYKQRFGKSLEANADTMREFLSETTLVEAVSEMAKLLKATLRPNVSVLNAIGTAILLADLVGRECYAGRMFSTQSAYYVMRWIERGQADLMDGGVLALTTHFVSEALEAAPPRSLGPALDLSAPCSGVIKLRLSHLQPGMRVASTLFTHTGDVVLERGVLIDSDIIWRLWRIAAVTPITIPEIEAGSICFDRDG